jgi:hypothetical protein
VRRLNSSDADRAFPGAFAGTGALTVPHTRAVAIVPVDVRFLGWVGLGRRRPAQRRSARQFGHELHAELELQLTGGRHVLGKPLGARGKSDVRLAMRPPGERDRPDRGRRSPVDSVRPVVHARRLHNVVAPDTMTGQMDGDDAFTVMSSGTATCQMFLGNPDPAHIRDVSYTMTVSGRRR